MIYIRNISKYYSRQTIQQYEVGINNAPLATFEHYSPDGMAACLRAAALAIERTEANRKIAEAYAAIASINSAPEEG